LRHLRLLRASASDSSPRALVRATLDLMTGSGGGTRECNAMVGASLPLPVQLSLPDWVWERLTGRLSPDQVAALARELLAPAPLDLRVNTLKATRAQVAERLAADRILARPTAYSPVGLRVEGKPALQRHPLLLDGAIEVQDEGSQLLAFLVAPRRREMVADFCAGAGGKTLALGAMMRSEGRLYAFDVSAARLAHMKPRLKRSGLSNVHPQLIDGERDARVRRLAGKIDRVLVDAPCTGFGTLRRNPDLKWRQSAEGMRALQEKQARILRAAAHLVKPGGRLVYATCSLLPEENQDIVAAFLGEQSVFRSVPCRDILAAQGIALDTGVFFEVFPHVHGTDGFFGAVLERSAES
jgi:16S rRNA (cytosine967-C5)-methyltransferase